MEKTVDGAQGRSPSGRTRDVVVLAIVAGAARLGGIEAGTSVAGESADWVRAVAPGFAGVGLDGAAAMIAMKVVGVVAAMAGVVGMGWLARAVFRDRVVALATAAVFAVVPVGWWWSTELVPDPLVASLVLGGVGGAAGLVSRYPSCRYARMIAVASGGGALVVIYVWSTTRVAIPPDATVRPWFDGALHAFSPVGVAIAAVGAVVGARYSPWAVGLAVAWIAPFAFVSWRAGVVGGELRAFLPIVPGVVLAIGALLSMLRRIGVGSLGVYAATAVLVGAMVVHALPDLRTVWSRRLPSDAVARYAAAEIPVGSLLVADAESTVVPLFASRLETVRLAMTAYEAAGADESIGTGPAVLARIDDACSGGRAVFATSLLGPDEVSILRAFCRLDPATRIDRDTLRGQWDPRLAWFGERLRRSADVVVWRVTRSKRAMVRVLRRPAVTTPAADHVVVDIDEPRAPNARVAVVLAQHPQSVDWTRDTFSRDNLLQRTLVTGVQRRLALDAAGRGTQRVVIPPDTPARFWVAYAIQAPDGELTSVSLPTPAERGP